jgi:hypothetical protein
MVIAPKPLESVADPGAIVGDTGSVARCRPLAAPWLAAASLVAQHVGASCHAAKRCTTRARGSPESVLDHALEK